jgi:hypothetical protein
MKNGKHNVELLIKKALRSTEKPDEKLVQKVKCKLVKNCDGKVEGEKEQTTNKDMVLGKQ